MTSKLLSHQRQSSRMKNKLVSEDRQKMATTNRDDVFNKSAQEAHQVFDSVSYSAGVTLEGFSQLPFAKPLSKLLGTEWLFGQMDLDKIYLKVNQVRQQYPQEDTKGLAHRLVVAKALEAGKLGVIANILPPIALFLFGIELAVIAKLLAELVYEIAHLYGLDLKDSKRRGEVLALFLLSLGGDTVKAGLNIFEIIPGLGIIIGASTNAILIYALGQTASQFYQSKTDVLASQNVEQF